MAQQVQSVVSAEADARMAEDRWVMARRNSDAVQQQMMSKCTDASWWSWQERVKAAKSATARAYNAYSDACDAVQAARKAA